MNDKNKDSQGCFDVVTRDTVYAQLYEEMRHHRRHELSVSVWSTTVLLAIFAAASTFRFSSAGSNLGQALWTDLRLQVPVALLAFVVGAGGFYSVLYSSWRYGQLREYVDKWLEPNWKQFRPRAIRLMPRHIILLTQGLLTLAIDLIVLWPA